MLFIIGGVMAFFFEFLLLSKKEKSLADKILAVWMFLIGIHLLSYYSWHSGLALEYPVLIGISGPFPYMHGPFLFLYTIALTGKMSRWKPVHLLHFLPVLIFYLYNLDFWFYTREQQAEFIEGIMAGEMNLFFRIFSPGILVSAATYHILTFLQFRQHRRNLKEQFSYTNDRIDLNWLRYLIIGISAIWISVLISYLNYDPLEGDDLIYVTVVIFVFFVGFFGVRQGNIFTTAPVAVNASGDKEGEHPDKRYAKSGLKKEVADNLEKKLVELMESDKLFMEESLTLPRVAAIVGVSPNYLSQVINERFGKNFYDFVNHYRVEEFKKLLRDPVKKNYTILSLAYEVGFNSKSSFNKYFKQTTGLTPSGYLKRIS